LHWAFAPGLSPEHPRWGVRNSKNVIKLSTDPSDDPHNRVNVKKINLLFRAKASVPRLLAQARMLLHPSALLACQTGTAGRKKPWLTRKPTSVIARGPSGTQQTTAVVRPRGPPTEGQKHDHMYSAVFTSEWNASEMFRVVGLIWRGVSFVCRAATPRAIYFPTLGGA
jgi:hypothetical protein